MSLAGKGVIAIWQDLVPEFKDEYREWHNRQHIPERLGIPGFRRARRFIAAEGGPEFYTLYEADRVEDMSGKAYLDRLNAPTQWTQKIMPAFRNMARSVCCVTYSVGAGEGGFMLTGRFGFPPAKESAADTEFLRILPPLCDLPGIAGVHLCLADESASGVQTFEKRFRAADDLIAPCVLMIEGNSFAHIKTASDQLRENVSPLLDKEPIDLAIYQLEYASSNHSNDDA
jgi:hypothetical protein